MKSYLFFIVLFVFGLCPCYAIQWTKLETPRGKVVYLDTDSISENSDYYFYNIKFPISKTESQVVTIQSKKNASLSARIKVYDEIEYNKLNGDYENIQKNITSKLEPAVYGSMVNVCHRQVKQIKNADNNIKGIVYE